MVTCQRKTHLHICWFWTCWILSQSKVRGKGQGKEPLTCIIVNFKIFKVVGYQQRYLLFVHSGAAGLRKLVYDNIDYKADSYSSMLCKASLAAVCRLDVLFYFHHCFAYLLHPPTDVPIPLALFAPLSAQGQNTSCSPQRGEWTRRQSRDHY